MSYRTEFNPSDRRRKEKIILCPPSDPETLKRAGVVKYTPPDGAQEIECQYCKEKMWVGPNQLEYIERNPGTVQLCMPCGARMKLFSWYDMSGVQHLGGVGGKYKFVTDN